MRLIEDHSIFESGRVLWDWLYDLRLDLPLFEQDALVSCEDVLAVKYPNGVMLDVSYLCRLRPEAHFVVAVVPVDEALEWTPAVRRVCRTFDELKAAILDLAPVARDWEK